MTRLWDRGEPLDDLILRYTAGDDHELDQRLVAFDCEASSAHAAMLHAHNLLSAGDLAALQAALADIAATHARGEWRVTVADEDCHTAIENRLVTATGEAGRRIHVGRSRNDQVLAALRLWLKQTMTTLAENADAVARALDHMAARQGSLPMPGYTHLQRAMPTTVALWAGGYASELRDDATGLRIARRRADRNPLGSAAGYGVPVLELDRSVTTRALGFAETHTPVTAVQLSRGKAEASALFEAALLAQDLGRLAADLCLFATAEFGFVKLPDRFTTGSSMLPQKRNPDVFELARGRTGLAVAALNEVLAITAKMPAGYHRDYQLMKAPLFRSLDSVADTANILTHALPEIAFVPQALERALDPSMLSAERAYRIVRDEGVPFRDAYRQAQAEASADFVGG